MGKVSFPVDAALVAELDESFFQGPMYNNDGLRFLGEAQVGRLNKMSIQIQADEHPPAHFHVKYGGEDASFGILDGQRLKNTKGLEKFEKNISVWWKEHRCHLILEWNRLRPTDCSVGPVPVPAECITPERGN